MKLIEYEMHSKHVLPLFDGIRNPAGQIYRRALGADGDDGSTTAGSIPIKSIKDEVFLTTVKIGNQDFTLLIDVGSADTWVAMSGIKCAQRSGIFAAVLDLSLGKLNCRFGNTYKNSSTFTQVPNQHFSTAYSDGGYARGIMGKETLTLGNLTVEQQPIGFANMAAWTGDGMSSGILGLAFPSITNAYAGTTIAKEKKLEGPRVPYPPIFTNMYRQKLIKPYFSMALNRASEGPGALAFGGLPGGNFRHTGNFTPAPLQQFAGTKLPPPGVMVEDGLKDFRFYVVNTDGFTVNSQPAIRGNGSMQVVVDSGSRLVHLPSKIVEAIAKKWQPPATLEPLTGNYIVNCTGTPPKVGVVFGGASISMDKEDLFLKTGGNMCISTIQKSPGDDSKGQWILGAPFLRSVIAIFDVGAAEMRFVKRVR
ncbi:aspartic-type endopeptidase protein [Venturia nashicola]|uniref:Aspartic-type endopeptidase protein n=1 Tax=Venturia nashicola TaxID=86259 RepID=A0A4Z1NSD1_9PEZI|nr:aspartic-type endopeptidase protein [Venturia nashicola]